MKLRIEKSGFHYFDRKTGLHFLLDEINPPTGKISISPRTFSIAITNDCNANCPFCHVPKGLDYLEKDFIVDFCKKIDELGCLDIAIGGGEPLLHPEIVEICKSIWTETNLGISITSNGQLLTDSLIEDLSENISFMRISIDSINSETYREIRNYDLDDIKQNLLKLKDKIPFGINMVVSSKTIYELDKMLDFAREIGAVELLLLPMINDGQILLNEFELKSLETWINLNYEKFPIRILEQARKQINIPILFENDDYYSDYLYLSATKNIQNNSYESNGMKTTICDIENNLMKWKNESTVCNKL